MKKVQSNASYMSEMDSDGNYAELEANMHLIDEFYYGVRIFPGQDPSQVRTAQVYGVRITRTNTPLHAHAHDVLSCTPFTEQGRIWIFGMTFLVTTDIFCLFTGVRWLGDTAIPRVLV